MYIMYIYSNRLEKLMEIQTDTKSIHLKLSDQFINQKLPHDQYFLIHTTELINKCDSPVWEINTQ